MITANTKKIRSRRRTGWGLAALLGAAVPATASAEVVCTFDGSTSYAGASGHCNQWHCSNGSFIHQWVGNPMYGTDLTNGKCGIHQVMFQEPKADGVATVLGAYGFGAKDGGGAAGGLARLVDAFLEVLTADVNTIANQYVENKRLQQKIEELQKQLSVCK